MTEPSGRNALSDLRSRETADLIDRMMGDPMEEAVEYLIDIAIKLHARANILEAEVAAMRPRGWGENDG